MDSSTKEKAIKIIRGLADTGKLLHFGFEEFASRLLPPDTDPEVRDSFQTAFMAGAEFLWSSLRVLFESGEFTEEDDRRASALNKEILAWAEEMKNKNSSNKE